LVTEVLNNYLLLNGDVSFSDWIIYSSPIFGLLVLIALLWRHKLTKTLNELRQSQQLLNNTQADAKIGGWSLNILTSKFECTLQAAIIHQTKFHADMTLETLINHYQFEDRATVAKSLKTCAKEGRSFEHEVRLIKPQHIKPIWIRMTGHAEYNAQGEIVSVRGSFQDISAQKQVEARVIQERQLLERLVQNASIVAFQIKRKSNNRISIPFISRNASEFFGIEVQSRIADAGDLLKLFEASDILTFQQQLSESAAKLQQFRWKGRLCGLTSKTRWVQSIATPRTNKAGDLIWDGLVFDISEQVEAELIAEQLKIEAIHSGKLASLGELAAEIGHEINNPLAIISGYAQKLFTDSQADRALSPQEVQVSAKRIYETSLRIVKIITSLRALAIRSDTRLHKTTNIHDLISNCLDLCQERFSKYGITIQVPLQNPVSIECVDQEIIQVIMNLLNNSFDAVRYLTERWIEIDIEEVGDQVEMVFMDSGTGINEEHQSKIWKPFFTTKSPSGGTGLGLSISKRIIESHGGEIHYDLDSAFTKFIVRLPKSQNMATDEAIELEKAG